MSGEILLPIGYTNDHPSIPRTMEGAVSTGTRGMREAMNIVDMLGKGPDYCPKAPILLVGPDGRQPILLIGDGVTTAAELQDMAIEAIGYQEESYRAHQRGEMDFDVLREKHGGVRRDEAGQRISDAIQQRIKHHLANPVTDPFRQPLRALGNQFLMPGMKEWKRP